MKRGCSLVEVMAAAAIFAVGLAAIFSAFGSGAAQLEHQRHLTYGIHLTESRLEELLLWSTTDPELREGTVFGPLWFDRDGFPAAASCPNDVTGLPALSTACRYRVTWQSTLGEISGVRVVSARTDWNEREQLKSVVFSTQRN